MSSVQTATTGPVATVAGETGRANPQTGVSPIGEVLRDITRGGVAGVIAGVIFAGIGGRLVMRLAAILVPASAGAATENGNLIGDITLAGSLGIILFVGLVVGLFAGTLWVIVSPWIPGSGVGRALLTIPVAIALTGTGLIDGDNQDFFILRHDPLVVASLVGLVALSGFALAMIDSWLDRRLPHTVVGRPGLMRAYTVVTFLGAVLVLPFVLIGSLGSTDGLTVLRGAALIAVGTATVVWWMRRIRGESRPSTAVTLTGRGGLLAACAIGFVAVIPAIGAALGIR